MVASGTVSIARAMPANARASPCCHQRIFQRHVAKIKPFLHEVNSQHQCKSGRPTKIASLYLFDLVRTIT